MTNEQIAAGIKIAEAATKGPWCSLPGKLRPQFPTKINQVFGPDRPVVNWSGFDNSDVPYKQHKANAEFIAFAGTHLKALLLELQSHRAAAERWKREAEEAERTSRLPSTSELDDEFLTLEAATLRRCAADIEGGTDGK